MAQLFTEMTLRPAIGLDSNEKNNNSRSETTVVKGNTSHFPGPNIRLRPMLTPLLPVSEFFRAKILHIDRQGVVWVLPNDHIKLLSKVTAEISSCTTVSEENQVDIGKLLVCQTGRTVVRGRILEVKERRVVFLNVDSGEPGQCGLQEVFAITPRLLSISPLAIPIKLYGMQLTQNQLDESSKLESVLVTIPKAQVTVSLLEPSLRSSFPIPAIVRYSGRSEDEVEANLALTLLDCGLMSVATSYRERQHSGLDWLNFSSDLPPLSSPPHPFPLAEGLWLGVTVQGIYFPLDEEQPTIECPHANKVSCHLVPLSSRVHFNFSHSQINSCARVSKNPLKSLEVAFEDLRERLAADAEEGGGELTAVSPGDGVLVFAGQEWCRATVLRQLGDQVVQVSYTDYGHNGTVQIGDLRTLKEKRRLEPVQVREFFFQMPESNEVRPSPPRFCTRVSFYQTNISPGSLESGGFSNQTLLVLFLIL